MANELSGSNKTESVYKHAEKGAEGAKHATSDTVDRAHDASAHAADKVEHGVHRAAGGVADAAERVADRAESAVERGREAFDEAMTHAGDWSDKACDYVREKPARSIAMALVAGWMVGWLMRR